MIGLMHVAYNWRLMTSERLIAIASEIIVGNVCVFLEKFPIKHDSKVSSLSLTKELNV